MKEEIAAKKIKDVYLEYQFRKCICHFQSLGIDKIGPLETFELFQKKIIEQDDTYITSIKKLLNRTKTQIRPQKLLSLFFIIHFKEEVLSCKNRKMNKLENALYKHSCLLSKYLHHKKIFHVIQDTRSLLRSFNTLFTCWLQQDKKRQIEELCDLYYNLPKSFDFDSKITKEVKQKYIEEQEKFRTNIREQIIKIAGKKGLQYLLAYGEKMKQIEGKMAEQVSRAMHKQYWDNFKKKLEGNDFSSVIELWTEIREIFIGFTYKNAMWRNRINEQFDVEYIQLQMHRNMFSRSNFQRILAFILDVIRELGAPVNDQGVISSKN